MTSTTLRFTKMHGAGNDFIVIDAISQDISRLTTKDWQYLANRQLGIGADQILLVEKPTVPDADFRYRIFNNDGSEVEQCGNGSRCFVRFVREQGLTDKSSIRVQVAHTVIVLTEENNGEVTVNMGQPIFGPELVPFQADGLATRAEGDATFYELQLTNSTVWVHVLSMGNPHAVQLVSDILKAPVGTTGPEIESHSRFPKRVNAGYMQIIHPHEIQLRVYERGAGETLACGTGACAAVVSGILQKKLTSPVLVHTRGGDLRISWQPGEAVMMTGPAQTVFEGQITF